MRTSTPFEQQRRRLVGVVVAALIATLGLVTVSAVTATSASAATDPCATGNAIACENSKPGDAQVDWDILRSGSDAIQGFSTSISVNPGSTVKFKVKATAKYTVDVYRLGYYAGLGARRQAPTWRVTPPAGQKYDCASDAFTQNYDCGAWPVSTQWTVPSTAVSGIYVALLSMGNNYSHITFVVRDDTSHSDVVFKTSDATWQAYNDYAGASYYTAPSSMTGTQARAFKISYNRPFATRNWQGGRDFLFSNEYPTLRFLERNGVDMSYTTDIDTSTGATVLTNHKAFLSVGHDEYWTLPERQNVEAARDAGVNMMFLSGNEVYWHTRLEPSIDGSATPNRTLVCYKDTWESTKLDPTPEGTPTWRDPLYAAPNGNNGENSLTGTMYMSNNTDLAITVSAAQGKDRMWRGTSLASLPAGGSATLAPHSIGYESDEDVDNGLRPAGLVRLSETTGATTQEVQNAGGNVVAPGTTTHSLTLYRAASGALVFGAGTINWGWGLDQTHDGDNSNPADSRMQQATLNLLSDMGVQPTTLMTGLVMPSAGSDTQAPTATITSPTAGATLANGTQVTFTGTAADAGGGVVGAVEVSLDGGATYHHATGTASWSYTTVLSGVGPTTIKVRASDDSANVGNPASVAVTIACPCSLFGVQAPVTAAVTDSSAVELGVKFTPDADGFVTAIRFFKGNGNTGTHTGTLWTSTGLPMASGTFTNETATGWQTLVLSSAVSVSAGTTYVASYNAPVGHYANDALFFSGNNYHAAPLTAGARAGGVPNGVFASGHAFPNQTFNDSYTNYWVDVLFSRDDTTPPAVATRSPLPGSSSVATTVQPSATFGATVDPTSVTMSLTDASNAPVSGTTAFDPSSRTARFSPAAPLAHGAAYTVSVFAKSASGVPMAAPTTWSFTVSTTDPVPGQCPCSIWTDTATPATASAADASNVEVGVQFKADVDGQISGIRFYKGSLNVGTHTGSLWTATGTRMATVVFSNETATGWQTGYFSTPVNVTAGTTYIASYRAPNGGYALTSGGLAAAVDSPPLHALAGGGVYTYSTTAPLTAGSSNYWVDVVYVATDEAPTVASSSPAASSTNVNVGATVSATLSSQILTGSGQMGVRDSSGTAVPGSVVYTASTRTLTFTPSQPLTAGTLYTATVNGAAALSGNVMSPYSWSFTTAGATVCPCSLFESGGTPLTADSGDASALELGVSFTPSVTGFVTGVRFYKTALNTGSHSGSLWDAAGHQLATGMFSGETATGWQTLTFASPVQLTVGVSYVASYHTSTGHYAATSGFFSGGYGNGPLTASTTNGLYAYGSSSSFPTGSFGGTNYWVDVAFTTGTLPDTTPPAVMATSPIAGASSQSWTAGSAATFNESLTPASVAFTLSSAAGPVTGTAAYNDASKTATFTPSGPLARGTTYTASVTAKDTAGNAMTAPTTWSYTTAAADPVPGQCPCSLWTDATTPATPSAADTDSVELGTSFTSDTSGSITGVRFYKGPQNTGVHTISVWAPDQSRMATATVGAETTTGWQTAYFASPVAITAGTTYVVSYLAPNGEYALTSGGLSVAVDNAPLHSSVTGGRFVYGGGYPSHSSSSSYWVDPVFATVAAPVADTIPPTVSGVAVATAGANATVSWTTDESSTSVVTYGTTSALGQTASGGSGTSHSVSLGGLTSGTTYYYRVGSADAAGNSTTAPASPAAPSAFTAADTTPPTVSGVNVATSGSTATVTWTTDEASTSSLSYGTTASLGQNASGASGTSHSITLTGLSSGTTYSYRVSSADPAGNASTSPASPAAPSTFVAADTAAPAISGVTVTGTGASRTITWTTDESSTTSLAYGKTTALGTTVTSTSGTSHSVTVSGLSGTTTYYYRVTSADPSGNSASSPASPAAPSTFATGDVTPPSVSAVTATGSGTSATVTWTTNESATSLVSYGTSSSTLTSSATGAAGTSHSVTLSGLTVNTRYYFRVTSADAAGNSTTTPATTSSPASYLPTVGPVTKTTVADFASGTGGYVSDTSGGELITAPTLGAEFTSGATGGTLPAGLATTPVATGGTTTVAGNVATVNGSQLSTSATYASGRTFAVSATVSPGQSIGWGSTATGSTGVQASFSMSAAGALSAVFADGHNVNGAQAIAGTFTGAAHEYRVDWSSTTATFFIDGVQQATNAFQPTVQLRVLMTDPVLDANPLGVDWVRAGVYATSSTYVSGVVDAGATVGWDTLTRDVVAPSGTAVTIQVRSGSTATPGTGWTGWATVSATTGSITRSARYLQYQVISTTSGTRFVSSATKGIQIGFHVL